ncbi:uncharacterized protein [Littorina saxatilis]|uniref:uncharacterized protein n=1 Tax=Littorina saxatilis TaxID=31220 RepID=UPI0038B46391
MAVVKKRQELYIENPAYDKGPESILPIQTAINSLAANPTPASTSGGVVSPDTGAQAYTDVDSKEEEEAKNARSAGGYERTRRVIFSKKPPDDTVPSYKEEVTIVDKDNYNNDDIDFHAFDNTRLGSKTRETAADVEGYSHIVINSKSREEEVQDPEDDKLITHDACGNPLRSKNALSTEGTPAHSDDYDHITFNPKGTEEHLQMGELQRQDDGNNPPTNENAEGKTTGRAARADDYSHIAINCGVGEELMREVQTSVREANIPDVDPYIQTSIQNDETEVVYENAFEKTAEECDDEFNGLTLSQLDSKKTAEECDDEFNGLTFSQLDSKKTAEECDDEFNGLTLSQLDSKKTAEECDDEFNGLTFSQLDSKKTAEECDDEFNGLTFSQLDSEKTGEECDDEFNGLTLSQLDSKKTAEECDDEFNGLRFSQLDSKKTEDPEYSHSSQV